MPSFKERSYQKELLDGDDIPFEDIRQNMYELDVINKFLGGHRITIEGIKTLLKNTTPVYPLDIVEVGCGGGDNLRVIAQWAERNQLPVSLCGIDINPECIAYAESRAANKNIDFICSDYKKIRFNKRPDVLFSSLFCHHFSDEELVFLLRWMQQNSGVGFFINDLHRHPLAYHSIKVLTQVFSKSRLVKNDAPLSVRRGFLGREWSRLFATAGIANFKCQWKWAFRWLITYKHDTNPHI